MFGVIEAGKIVVYIPSVGPNEYLLVLSAGPTDLPMSSFLNFNLTKMKIETRFYPTFTYGKWFRKVLDDGSF